MMMGNIVSKCDRENVDGRLLHGGQALVRATLQLTRSGSARTINLQAAAYSITADSMFLSNELLLSPAQLGS